MLPPEIGNQTVTRLRATTSTDTHGNTVLSWTSPTPLTVEGCSVQPMDGSEYLLGRDSVTSRWQWFGPEGADVKSNDRIRHEGVDYDIDGSVQRWTDPTGNGLDHLVCFLRRVDG